jgi:hypothetical protein
MFWKGPQKPLPAVVTPYGVFTWVANLSAWSCEHSWKNQCLSLTYMGNPFNPVDLSRFEEALGHLDKLSELALAANQRYIAEYGHRIDQMSLDGITLDPEAADEDLQLNFSFDDWPDGGLTVHFKEQRVVDSHIVD